MSKVASKGQSNDSAEFIVSQPGARRGRGSGEVTMSSGRHMAAGRNIKDGEHKKPHSGHVDVSMQVLLTQISLQI
jgi:hypothetical protein